MAYSYDSLNDLLHNYLRLKAHGITPHRTAEYGPIVAMHYLDPSGLAIELSTRRFASSREIEQYCANGCLVESAGVQSLDPEKLAGKALKAAVN